MLTEEQRIIIEETIKNPDGTYGIAAVAGSGKSFTIFQAIDYIKEHEPNAKILYLVFNKANQVSAQAKLNKYNGWPSELQPKVYTAHAYAYKKWLKVFGPFSPISKFDWGLIREITQSKKYEYRPDVRFSKKAPFDKLLELYESSKMILDTFCEEYELKFDDYYNGPDGPKMLKLTDTKGRQMRKFGIPVNGYCCITKEHIGAFKEIYNLHIKKKKFTHGMYLKHAAYSPKAGGDEWDYVFFDEAQDSNYFMIKLLEKQKLHKVYYVGDSRQSIYNFGRANENVFKTKDFDKTYKLSKSFRFGDRVAKLANKIIHLDTPEQTCYGTEQTHETNLNSHAILFRTNSTLVQHALDLALTSKHENEKLKISLMTSIYDNGDAKFQELMSFLGMYYQYHDIETFMNISKYLPSEVYPSLAGFYDNLQKTRNFDRVYYEQYEYLSEDIKNMFEYAKDEKNFVEKYIALRECINRTEYDKLITFTTMHKSKGLEWDIVEICEPIKLYFQDKNGVFHRNQDYLSELNLAYVAVTRARKELYAQELYHVLSEDYPIRFKDIMDFIISTVGDEFIESTKQLAERIINEHGTTVI